MPMQEVATEIQTTRKRHSFPPGIAPNPSGSRVPRGLNELVAELSTDFADVALSAIDKALLKSAALLLLRASRTADPDSSVRSVSEARRISGRHEAAPPGGLAFAFVRVVRRHRQACGGRERCTARSRACRCAAEGDEMNAPTATAEPPEGPREGGESRLFVDEGEP